MSEREKIGNMRIIELTDRPPLLVQHLVSVWEASVRETHLFLSSAEITAIKGYLPQALADVPHLIVAAGVSGKPAAFMGVGDGMLEMLFVSPSARGHGLGTRLLRYGMEKYAVRELGVNEQNPQARGFYEHMGFRVYKRTDLDAQGNPYPILYMRLADRV